MLSYMLPGDDKPLGLPPPHPNSLPGDLTPATSEEKPSPPESSVSTASSLDKPRAKFAGINGTKHAGLKRVSFGSSKGSMVETLVYESPLQEEPEESAALLPYDSDEADNAAKVRVTFFQAEKPLNVTSPEPNEDQAPLDPDMSATIVTTLPDGHPAFHRQESTDSGWDNPFRPDGDLSREADEIVEMIKGGKPITPTTATSGVTFDQTDALLASAVTTTAAPRGSAPGSPVKTAANGSTGAAAANGGEGVEVTHGRVTAADASQVEHVVLKKKPRCKCCVIQ
ncbi:uncharacterized protein LOC132197866 [Neocloeon triangulifer]|uniref:uncharacterized protein LOC132197866 n=1 Tax=Neocloeon triangulifer TaxID=2078957 RepID=UPI00286EC410|nr:uncharacterized protein LOC132197866 [Neocloeon triangulifer]XP_059477438.1 uncharacterized protein LOC132197866 [Neocloeon triangulifer]